VPALLTEGIALLFCHDRIDVKDQVENLKKQGCLRSLFIRDSPRRQIVQKEHYPMAL
jgi:hypothetical protein